MLYLAKSPALLKDLWPTARNQLMLASGVLAALFVLTYLPLVAVLTLVSGPLSPVAAFTAVLVEARMVIGFLNTFLFGGRQRAEERIFDAVLVAKGHSSLVERGRTVKRRSNGVRVLGQPLNLLRPHSHSKYSTVRPSALVFCHVALLYSGNDPDAHTLSSCCAVVGGTGAVSHFASPQRDPCHWDGPVFALQRRVCWNYSAGTVL